LAAATVATFAYAAYDRDFRRWMGDNVPYTEEFLKVVLQEQTTYLEQLQAMYESLKSVWVSSANQSFVPLCVCFAFILCTILMLDVTRLFFT